MSRDQNSPVSAVKPLAVSRNEAAALLGVDVQTIDRQIADKKLRASKIGRRVIVRFVHLEKMLDASEI
jgi:excisionase family DNA binding protein